MTARAVVHSLADGEHDAVPAALRRFMDATGRHNLQRPDPPAWTLPQALGVVARLTGHTIPGAAK